MDRRIAELDSLRGLAAIGVALFHAYGAPLFWMWSLVDLFFVLSGFLITGILLRIDSGLSSVGSFYMRRALRIWPVYYMALGLALALGFVLLLRGHPPPDGGEILRSMFFLQRSPLYLEYAGWIDAGPQQQPLAFFSQAWSVAIEEQFYLLWPVVVLCLRRSKGTLATLCVVAVVASVCLRARGWDSWLLFARLDGLALGSLIAIAGSGHDRDRIGLPGRYLLAWRLMLSISLAGGLYLALPYVARGYTGAAAAGIDLSDPQDSASVILGFTLCFFAAVGFCVMASGASWLSPLRTPALLQLGGISYALYMFHLPIIHVFVGVLDRAPAEFSPLATLALWGSIVGAAWLSRRAVELRFERLKARYPMQPMTAVPRRPAGAAATLPLAQASNAAT